MHGSWFIQALTKCLRRYGRTLDLMSILTRVNHEVAYEFESLASNREYSGKKQVPSIVSTLTKDVFFPPKKGGPPSRMLWYPIPRVLSAPTWLFSVLLLCSGLTNGNHLDTCEPPIRWHSTHILWHQNVILASASKTRFNTHTHTNTKHSGYGCHGSFLKISGRLHFLIFILVLLLLLVGLSNWMW